MRDVFFSSPSTTMSWRRLRVKKGGTDKEILDWCFTQVGRKPN